MLREQQEDGRSLFLRLRVLSRGVSKHRGQRAAIESRSDVDTQTHPSERDAVLVKLANGRGVNTRLFSLDVPGADDVDPDPVTASSEPRTGNEIQRSSSSTYRLAIVFDSRSPFSGQILGQARDGRLGRVVKHLRRQRSPGISTTNRIHDLNGPGTHVSQRFVQSGLVVDLRAHRRDDHDRAWRGDNTDSRAFYQRIVVRYTIVGVSSPEVNLVLTQYLAAAWAI
jgi:hypothetical protein